MLKYLENESAHCSDRATGLSKINQCHEKYQDLSRKRFQKQTKKETNKQEQQIQTRKASAVNFENLKLGLEQEVKEQQKAE